MFYKIITYGCQMNEHESEKLSGLLNELGYKKTDRIEDCAIVVFNTCCIRENAEKKTNGHIGNLKALKLKNPGLVIAVVGCMTQQQGYAEKLKEKFPFIDIILGTHNINKFKDILTNFLSDRKKILSVEKDNNLIDENIKPYRESKPKANVNIMYGCDNFCTYCIVPHVRGRERSRKAENILNEVKLLLEDGYLDITLLGQNVNSYKDENFDFADLITKIAKIDKKFRLRFMTSHPKDLSEKVIKVIAEYDNICKSIHLPLQAGSDKILNLMNRKYTSKDYLDKIDLIRSYNPDIEISTDIMVGFPTETENDFTDTFNLVKKARFSYAFTFIYSKRSGTAASLMDNQVETAVKKERIQKIINLQKEISYAKNLECVGKIYEVLTEEISDIKKNIQMGRTTYDKQVFFEGNTETGSFNNIKITRATPTALFGEIA